MTTGGFRRSWKCFVLQNDIECMVKNMGALKEYLSIWNFLISSPVAITALKFTNKKCFLIFAQHEADRVFGPGLPHKINNFDNA